MIEVQVPPSMHKCEAGFFRICGDKAVRQCACCKLFLCGRHLCRPGGEDTQNSKAGSFEVRVSVLDENGNWGEEVVCTGSKIYCEGYMKAARTFSRYRSALFFGVNKVIREVERDGEEQRCAEEERGRSREDERGGGDGSGEETDEEGRDEDMPYL